MVFKEMDPDEVRKALEGQTNVIEAEMAKVTSYFSSLQCLYCGGSCRPTTFPEKLFLEGSILPNFIAECNDCCAQFSPYTKIEIRGPMKDPLADEI